MVVQLQDNTAVRKLRREIKDMADSYEERMLREVARMKEEAADLDEEIREGMSNRIGDGFIENEAKKYAKRVKESFFEEAGANLLSIGSALKGDIQDMIGEAMDVEAVGGTIGTARQMILEQSELDIVKLPAPIEEAP